MHYEAKLGGQRDEPKARALLGRACELGSKAACDSLAGKKLDDGAVREAANLAAEAAEPIEDWRGSEEYKRHLVKTLTSRALKKASERAEGGAA
jgi:CO/xanthine dehydrogenase FAD-binding subunit